MINRLTRTVAIFAFAAAILLSTGAISAPTNAADEAAPPKLAIELGAPFTDNAILQR